jgi:hypothetical protein
MVGVNAAATAQGAAGQISKVIAPPPPESTHMSLLLAVPDDQCPAGPVNE